MTHLIMKNEGFRLYKNLYVGRRRVGRIQRRMDGTYIGVINPGRFNAGIRVVAPTELQAFDQIAARYRLLSPATELREDHRRQRRYNDPFITVVEGFIKTINREGR